MKVFSICVVAITAFVVLFLFSGISSLVREKPPELFDTTNINNVYSIGLLGPHYSINVYNKETGSTAQVIAGSSPVSLAQFVGKTVKVEGYFKYLGGKDTICRPGFENECSADLKAVGFIIQTIILIE